jgi:hypothetical protein
MWQEKPPWAGIGPPDSTPGLGLSSSANMYGLLVRDLGSVITVLGASVLMPCDRS